MHLRFVALQLFLIAVLGAMPLACVGKDGDARTPPPSPVVTSSPTSTATPRAPQSLVDEVLEAYMAYWEAYSLALLNLDPAQAEPVAAGEELERIHEEIGTLRSQGVAARVVVQHNSAVVEVSKGSAVIFDEMVDNSFYVDPVTKEPPIASGSGEVLRDLFYLERVDGKWIVVRSVRQR